MSLEYGGGSEPRRRPRPLIDFSSPPSKTSTLQEDLVELAESSSSSASSDLPHPFLAFEGEDDFSLFSLNCLSNFFSSSDGNEVGRVPGRDKSIFVPQLRKGKMITS